MKILVITPTYLPIVGGAEVAIFEVYKRLCQRHSVSILTPWLKHAPTTLDEYYNESSIAVHRFRDRVNFAKKPVQEFTAQRVPPVSLSFLYHTARVVQTLQPDVVNVHYVIPTGLSVWYLEKIKKIPVLLSLPGRADAFQEINPFYKHHARLMRWVVDTATKVSSPSEYTLGSLPRGEKYDCCPHGAELPSANPAVTPETLRAKFGLKSSERVLFTLSRLDAAKRIELLIEAVSLLPEKQRSECVLVIGGTGPEEPALRECAASFEGKIKIIFAGYIPDDELRAYFSLSYLFLFASYFETFGIVLAQSLVAGLPVVALESSCVREVVQDGRDSIVISSGAVSEMAEEIATLLNDLSRRKEMAESALSRASHLYSWDRAALHYEELLSSVCAVGRESR